MASRGSTTSRRTASQSAANAKKKTITLDINAANTAGDQSNPPTVSPSRPITVLPENARKFLEDHNILQENTEISIELIFSSLVNTANDRNVSEEILRASILALVHTARLHLPEHIAFLTADLIGERLKQINIDEQEKNKKVRDELEAARADAAKEKEELATERAKVVIANNELCSEMRKTREETKRWTLNLTKSLEEIKKSIDEVTDGLRMDNFYAGNATFQSAWGGFAPAANTTFGLQGHQTFIPQTHQPAHPPTANEDLERVKAAEDKRDRQLMFDPIENNGKKSTDGYSNSKIEEEINNAITQIMEDDSIPTKPTTFICTKAIKLAKGGVLITLSDRKAKNFLANPEVHAKLSTLLPFQLKVIPRLYKVIFEQVPIEAEPNEDLMREIEATNDLPENEIASLKWMKNPSRRSDKQRHAHMLAEFRTKTGANAFIQGKKKVAGKICDSSKYLSEATRCFKCQKTGHQRKNCTNPTPACGQCAGSHFTENCNRPGLYWCAVCAQDGGEAGKGHPAYSRDCPKFKAGNLEQAKHIPDRFYTYYITDEAWTWGNRSNRTYEPYKPSGKIGDLNIQHGKRGQDRQVRSNTSHAPSRAMSRNSVHTTRSTTPDADRTVLAPTPRRPLSIIQQTLFQSGMTLTSTPVHPEARAQTLSPNLTRNPASPAPSFTTAFSQPNLSHV